MFKSPRQVGSVLCILLKDSAWQEAAKASSDRSWFSNSGSNKKLLGALGLTTSNKKLLFVSMKSLAGCLVACTEPGI